MCQEQHVDDRAVHVHIHGCGCQKDAPLHVHIHFQCEGKDDVSPRRAMRVFTPISTGTTPVHVKSSGNFICVRGNQSANFTSVRAQIYRSGDTPPSSPPYAAASGQIVNMLGFPPHLACTTCNFVFEAAFKNEVGNAKCSTTGDNDNKLVVWFMNGTHVIATEVVPFTGVCGSATACAGSGGTFASDPPDSSAQELGPRIYLLEALREKGDRPPDKSVADALSRGPIALLRRDATASTGMIVWDCIDEASQHGIWELVVINQGGRRMATLEHSTAASGPRHVWMAPQWELYKKNELYPAVSGPYDLPVLVIQPSWTAGT